MPADDETGVIPLCELLDPVLPCECMNCGEPVTLDDERVPMGHIDEHGKQSAKWWHRECAFRAVFGGLAHYERRCKCFVADAVDDTDDPSLTKRESARAVFDAFRKLHNN